MYREAKMFLAVVSSKIKSKQSQVRRQIEPRQGGTVIQGPKIVVEPSNTKKKKGKISKFDISCEYFTYLV